MTTQTYSAVFGDELLPGLDLGGYIIHSKIGEGGMGIVYAAVQPVHRTRVAIKVLGPAFSRDAAMVARFEQEAQMISGIHHPNIVEIHNLGMLVDGRKYIVMELLEGEPLTARIDRAPIPALEGMEIIDAVCDALIAVHARGIVHRDLKSDNVFLANIGGARRVKLLDFGLAKQSSSPSGMKTMTGMVVGTPQYVSPDQIRGEPASPATDTYSLGILSFKILVGKVPWDGEQMAILANHLQTPPPLASDLVPTIPAGVATLVQRMMAKRADERPTLAQLRAAFADIRAGGSGLPHAPTRAAGSEAVRAEASVSTATASAGPRRPAWVYAVLVLAVLASAVIAFAVVKAAG
jgi:eukaryotic-like serine/threonine-protein kinase